MAADRLFSRVEAWICRDPNVVSAALFGSRARSPGHTAAWDRWSDIDLHLIASKPGRVELVDWAVQFADFGYVTHTTRPATGGVRKITIIFTEGEIDLILVPVRYMQIAQLACSVGWHKRISLVREPLDTLATILSGGYRFLKGEAQWGRFYHRIATEMNGFRIADSAAENIANGFLCDLIWVRQKILRGEEIAVQRMIHRSLIEANVLLLHELRLRKGLSTFQQGRRIEQLASEREVEFLRWRGDLSVSGVYEGTERLLAGVVALMGELVPHWSVPPNFQAALINLTSQRPTPAN
jgi:hypothetical protein